MSKFYSEIAKYYDDIFPIGKPQINFLTEILNKPPKDILDVACGSGGYAVYFSQMGYNLVAIDLNHDMISKLKEKDQKIDARILDMLKINTLNKKFDLIYCIGNSLVHLDNLEEMMQFIMSCKDSLKENGNLVIQIVNYDRILDQSIQSLPTIKNDNVPLIFERNYIYLSEKHKIDFHTRLIVDEIILENHEYLYPLRYKELQKMLKDAGFSNTIFYGSFMKDIYNPQSSFSLVVHAY